jgi:hypothetical protein
MEGLGAIQWAGNAGGMAFDCKNTPGKEVGTAANLGYGTGGGMKSLHTVLPWCTRALG